MGPNCHKCLAKEFRLFSIANNFFSRKLYHSVVSSSGPYVCRHGVGVLSLPGKLLLTILSQNWYLCVKITF